MEKCNNGSFVAISDFHSYSWPLKKIKLYLKEYDVVYVLGDSIDRGPEKNGSGGLKLLIEIMDLCNKYPGKLVYVPGNHDEMLYRYMSCPKDQNNPIYNYSNGTKGTIRDCNNLKRNNYKLYQELYTWLGNLPIQYKHEYHGRKYALAHALFNEKLYDLNPNLCLKDYANLLYGKKSKDMVERIFNILWFRKNDSTFMYHKNELPSSDTTMVVGHTPPKSRTYGDLNLINDSGEIIEVECVDEGIAYSLNHDTMRKYDFNGSHVTRIYYHEDTSNTKNNAKNVVTKNNKSTRTSNSLYKTVIYPKRPSTATRVVATEPLILSELKKIIRELGYTINYGLDELESLTGLNKRTITILLSTVVLSFGLLLSSREKVAPELPNDPIETPSPIVRIENDYSYYTVVSGDTLYGIAEKYGMTLDELYELNPGVTSLIHPGDQIKVQSKVEDAAYSLKLI